MRWKWIEMGQCLWFSTWKGQLTSVNIQLRCYTASPSVHLFQRETWQGLDPEQVKYKGLPYNILVLVI